MPLLITLIAIVFVSAIVAAIVTSLLEINHNVRTIKETLDAKSSRITSMSDLDIELRNAEANR